MLFKNRLKTAKIDHNLTTVPDVNHTFPLLSFNGLCVITTVIATVTNKHGAKAPSYTTLAKIPK